MEIRKQIAVRVPLSRVWRALADSREFGTWFGMKIDGPFVAGSAIRGVMTPTEADREVAAMQKPHEGTPFEIHIETIEPESRFSFRWHPFAIDPNADYSNEPMTLVTFTLEDAGNGEVRVTVTESGFENIPIERRAAAFTANDGGWTIMSKVLGKYVSEADA